MNEEVVAESAWRAGSVKAGPEGHEQNQGQNQKQRQDSHKLIIQGCRQGDGRSGYWNFLQCAATVRVRLLSMVMSVAAAMRRHGFQV